MTDADGTLVVDSETGAYTYTVNNGSAAVQALGVGEVITKTFTYTVTDDGAAEDRHGDADGDDRRHQ